ncbi:MAG: type I restriction endonuclease subunit R [Nitrospirae bacterium]|nr:type I restriction endonuclease subunit R [Nitrospirota bacterium]
MSEFTEYSLIEQPAIALFQSLGYSYQNCYHEIVGEKGSLGRETSTDIILIPKLREALCNFNPNIPNEAIEQAIEELTRDRSVLNPVNANREIYKLIRDGVKVKIKREDGAEEDETVKVIEFDNPERNDFFLASQFWVTGEMYKRRADLVGFVNGLPLIFIELKAVHKKLENAFRDNLTDYKDTIPQIFWYNAFIVLSNGSESRIGSISSEYEHFSEWKKINSEGEEGIVSLETIIKGTCDKRKLLDLIENFILFSDTGGSLIKIIAKNHQFLGVNNAIESFSKIKENQGRLGVFWHTQGSGKSYSMIFFSQKILRKFEGNYTFLIVTDRKELDEQIYKNFAFAGAVTEQEVHAESGKHLEQLLKEDHRNIFTLIHKFGDINYKVSYRSDIIVIADEAHRSQYDTLAMNMRTAIPNAAFIAFTGTPLIAGEELTRKTFGDYISIYNFKQSADDNATVPLYYENRIPEVQLKNEDLNEDLERIIEEAMLSPEQEEKLQREFAREYHIITRDDRLEKIAGDIVTHFISRGYQGKAMVVSIDKPTAVKMYDKVQKHWQIHLKELRIKRADEPQDRTQDIAEKITYMEETDMAVVVSSEQNEIQKFIKLGLDIEKHRRRMVKENMSEKFKEPHDPFRIVFVCAMWMTGFDVPSLSTIYLDKPMKNHTLMQTIARANRVFGDKKNGLIVDYVGIFRNLQKALAIYGTGSGGGIEEGDTPVKPKSELVRELEQAIKETEDFYKERGVDIKKITDTNDKLEKIRLIANAADAFMVNDDTKNRFLLLASNVMKLFKAILPDAEAGKFYDKCIVLNVIAGKIRSETGDEVDISAVMGKVKDLLDESIEAEGFLIRESIGANRVDLSRIDFEALRKQFDKGRKNTQAAGLKAAISAKLNSMVRLNRARINYLEKFQQLIDEYNSGAINVEIFFERLMAFMKDLNDEEKRGVSENLTEEELAIFDLLKKSGMTKAETQQVKLASKNLLIKLTKEKLVLDWRRKQQTRADVQFTIETVLDEMLPKSYLPDLYQQKCNTVYQHVYDSYYGAGKSVYGN